MGEVKQISVKNLNLLFLQRHDQSQRFRFKIVKKLQKILQRD